jgi:hypothetical protein
MIDGWNWYVGADVLAIGDEQYDYQSVFTHELGHMLGLEHRDMDGMSVMRSTLVQGQVRRGFSRGDLAVLDYLYGGVSGMALPTLANPATVAVSAARLDERNRGADAALVPVLSASKEEEFSGPPASVPLDAETSLTADAPRYPDPRAVDRLFNLDEAESHRLARAKPQAASIELGEEWWLPL